MTTMVINNFVRGKLDRELNGRFDLPLLGSGFSYIENFLCNYKGNLKNRTGFEFTSKTKDNNVAKLFEFKFNKDQSYLVEATSNTMRFYTYDANGNFGRIKSAEPTSSIPKMTSNSTDGYECADSRNSNDCYVLLNGVGARSIGSWSTYWFRIKYPSKYYLLEYKITADSHIAAEYPSSWEVQGSNDGNTWTKIRSEKGQGFSLGQTKTFKTYNTAAYQYYRIRFISGNEAYGNGQLGRLQFFGATSLADDVELDSGVLYDDIKDAVFAQNADVMFITSPKINPKKLTRTGAIEFKIENDVPKGIDFEAVGFPRAVTFYKGRLWYGGFAKKPTTIKGSKVTVYNEFTVPTSGAKADDPVSFALSDISTPILWLYGGKRNLVAGNSEGISIVNGGSTDEPITATAINADLANREGCSAAYPCEKDSKMIYASIDKTRAYAFDFDLMSESFVSKDLNLLSENLGLIEELTYKRDTNNLVYARLANGKMIGLVYNQMENIIGWFPMKTKGFVHSVCTVSRPDGKDDLFICVERNGQFYIERLSDEVEFTDFYDTDYRNDPKKEKFNRLQMEELKNCVYVDNASKFSDLRTDKIVFSEGKATLDSTSWKPENVGHYIVYKTTDGSERGTARIDAIDSDKVASVTILSEGMYPLEYDSWYLTFKQVSGLEDLDNTEVDVVADGGYIGKRKVKDGLLDLGREYTSCVIGYGYTSLAKTFNIGAAGNGYNGQTMMKRISKFVLRFVDSAGFKIGTSLDRLQAIQEFNPNGFYDTTPLLMNSDETVVGYNDEQNKRKVVYMVQDEPLPSNLTMLEFDISFGGMK